MKVITARNLHVLFWIYVVATFLHIAYVVSCEPFAFDAWNVAVDTGARPPSIGGFFEFWYSQYTTSNPRLGQPLAYLAYKLVGFAEIGTPSAFLLIILAGFVLATGRWPSRKNGRDLATLAIAIGLIWFASPNFAAYMFCRAYATNYVWSAAIQLWLLAALRLHDVQAPVRPAKLVGIAALGVLAGMCNEHTGPTLLLLILVHIAWIWRSRRVRAWFSYAAACGTVVGYALLFFAPGQNQRYDGLGDEHSVIQQVLVRGISGNFDILQGLMLAAAPLLLVMVLVIVVGMFAERRDEQALPEVVRQQRGALAAVGIALTAGVLITATLFASPKLGPRFYMHAMVGLLAGVMAVMRAFLHTPRSFAPFVVVSVLASSYAAVRTIPSYSRYSRDSERRLAGLAATSKGSVYTADGWDQISETWWFLGDDFRDQKKRELAARYFGLERVLYRGAGLWSTLGVTDVKLTTLYQTEPAVCLDEIDRLDLKPYFGRDVAALHHAFLDSIAEIQREASVRLRAIDLTVTFLGPEPPLPQGKMYVARWRDGVLEGYVSTLSRSGRSAERTITVPPELANAGWEVYLVALGEPPRLLGKGSARKFTYRPWRTAPYWALACKADACFITMAMHHAI